MATDLAAPERVYRKVTPGDLAWVARHLFDYSYEVRTRGHWLHAWFLRRVALHVERGCIGKVVAARKNRDVA